MGCDALCFCSLYFQCHFDLIMCFPWKTGTLWDVLWIMFEHCKILFSFKAVIHTRTHTLYSQLSMSRLCSLQLIHVTFRSTCTPVELLLSSLCPYFCSWNKSRAAAWVLMRPLQRVVKWFNYIIKSDSFNSNFMWRPTCISEEELTKCLLEIKVLQMKV